MPATKKAVKKKPALQGGILKRVKKSNPIVKFLMVAAFAAVGYFVISSFAATNPYTCNDPKPKVGPASTNKECIKYLKWNLSRLNYSVDHTEGTYSEKLGNYIKDYQSKNGLEANGVVGTNMWNMLAKEVAGVPPALGGPNSNQNQTAIERSAPQPPTRPESLTISMVTSTQISLNWRPSTDPELGSEGIAGYRVIRNGSLAYKVQGNNIVFNDTNVQPKTQYTYSVRAVDVAGNFSEHSVERRVTTPAATTLSKPGTPQGVKASIISPTEMKLSWEKSSGKVDHYTVYSTTLLDSIGGNTGDTFLIMRGLTPGATYKLAVAAITSGGVASDPSTPVEVTLPQNAQDLDTIIPDAPKNLKAEILGSDQVKLEWTAPAADDVENYTVTREPINVTMNPFEIKAGTVKFESRSTSFLDTSVIAKAKYRYTVVANDEAHNSSRASKELVIQLPAPDSNPPSDPVNLKASASMRSVKLSWDKSSDAESGIAHYTIFRNNDPLDIVLQTKGKRISFTDSYVDPESTYYYTITAWDKEGNPSKGKATVKVVTPKATFVNSIWDTISGWWPF